MERAFSASGRRLSLRDLLVLGLTALFGMGAYLIASARIYRLGFPLDDSWIHATYARNLAQFHQWAFQLGVPSAGSTSPLWTLALTPGYWLGSAPLWWSHFLGFVTLVGLAVLAEWTTRELAQEYHPRLPWIGIFVTLEWHMLWAAVSGMETLFQAALSTAVLALVVTGSRRYAALGMLSGLAVWVRPDGVLLVLPISLVLMLRSQDGSSRLRAMSSFLLGFAALFLPYVTFNLWLSGTPMPNTFYAKQAEYGAWQARPLLYRLGVGLVQYSTGPFLLLWPGLIFVAIAAFRKRSLEVVAALLWCGLYSVIYLLRLPAYQHGRYLMPAMPMAFVLALLGLLQVSRSGVLHRYQWAIMWAWRAGLLLLTAAFVFLGARSYGQDVGLIESEMVNTASWVDSHIPAGAIIAAHDIGALGYLDHHQLIDLAGLVSPEVVPFIRDEERLAAFLDARGADYLIAFPDLYPDLARHSTAVFSSGGRFAPALGEGNLTVYCWRCR